MIYFVVLPIVGSFPRRSMQYYWRIHWIRTIRFISQLICHSLESSFKFPVSQPYSSHSHSRHLHISRNGPLCIYDFIHWSPDFWWGNLNLPSGNQDTYTSVATVNDRHFWKFEIAWERKFEKLPKYLGGWRTPKTGGSHFGPKESDQWLSRYGISYKISLVNAGFVTGAIFW